MQNFYLKKVFIFAFSLSLFSFIQCVIQWNNNWAHGCDFRNQDLSNVKIPPEQCGPRCDATPGCTHFTWSNWNGGTCWLKQGPASKSTAFETGDKSMVCGIATTNNDKWKIVWTEDFNTLDRSRWQIEVNCDGGGNNELQCYTDRQSNVMVQNGFLILKAIPENYKNKQYTSGRIKQISDGFLYGKMEARAKVPSGKHLWPAFWMLPQHWVYGGWAASGEIDILEYRGQVTDKVEGTLHFGGAWPNNIYQGSGPTSFHTDLSRDFHIYAVEWDADEIRWYVDGRQYYSMTLNRSFWSKKGSDPYNGRQRAPFDQKFQFILNLAIGGNFFPSNVYGSLTQSEARQWRSPEFVIDWVRVSQRI